MDFAIETLGEFAPLPRKPRGPHCRGRHFRPARRREPRGVPHARPRTRDSLEIIPGDEEARLSFLAIRAETHTGAADRLLVIDIGGGSTEVIFGGRSQIQSRVSLPLGRCA